MNVDENLNYSFEDLIPYKFMYDSEAKIIEISFDSYYYLDEYIEKRCTLSIRNWKEAKGKLQKEVNYYDIESYLGLVSLLLSIETDENSSYLKMTIMTIDGRYVDWYFKYPIFELKID